MKMKTILTLLVLTVVLLPYTTQADEPAIAIALTGIEPPVLI